MNIAAAPPAAAPPAAAPPAAVIKKNRTNHQVRAISLKPKSQYPAFYNNLDSGSQRKFRSLWRLIQNIKNNPSALRERSSGTPSFLSLKDFPLNLRNLKNNDGTSPHLTEFFQEQRISLRLAELTNANLSMTNFDSADFMGSCLEGAKFIQTSLQGANLSEANFTGAELSGSVFSEATKLHNTELYNIKINPSMGIHVEQDNPNKERIILRDEKSIKKWFESKGAKNISFQAA